MKLKDFVKSGGLGVLPAAIARDPNVARPFGLLGMAYADQKADDEAERQAAVAQAGQVPAMKKGGKVKGYSIDGIAQRGKTRAKQK